MQTQLEDEERALGTWPRRLLHVPTLTSYAWQPGNVYNGIKEPRYNAITYTWGRWRLAEDRSDVHAIPISINGDFWPIPRVDPEHFTVAEFENIIRSATCSEDPDDADHTEFIWLDIACIHQGDDPRSAAEIGRQALIFHGAKGVFVWLTTHRHYTLKEIMDDIYWFHEARLSEHTALHWRAMENLSLLLDDPWFSSLWTLQESFLRTDARLLPREGKLVENAAKKYYVPDRPARLLACRLCDILDICADWREISGRVTSGRTEVVEEAYQTSMRLVNTKGLIALSSRHRVNLYIAAQSRTASRKEDRIYGIQQIFNLRLGKSDLSSTGQSFDFAMLDNQLCEQLLLHLPIESQMHTFSKHVPDYLRWRIHPCSRPLGRMDLNFRPRAINVAGNSNMFPRCSFVIHHYNRAVSWTGQMTKFQDMKKQWEYMCTRYSQARPSPSYVGSGPPLHVGLDAVEELADAPASGEDSTEAIDWLVKTFPSDMLHVLLLGFGRTILEEDEMYGLLLLRQRKQWARIGVCRWFHSSEWPTERHEVLDEDLDFLHGFGEHWVDRSGVLGCVQDTAG